MSADDRAFLDEIADAIARRRLISPALFFLESSKPLNFVASQLLVFLRPFIGMWWDRPATWDRLQRLLEQRASIELLVRRLEARA